MAQTGHLAGDMIVWDNRTSHCNCPGAIPRAQIAGEAEDLLRATVYVCMAPRTLASNDAVAQRQASYREHKDLGLHACGHTYRQSIDDPQFSMEDFHFDEYGIPVPEKLPWVESDKMVFRKAPRAQLNGLQRSMVPL